MNQSVHTNFLNSLIEGKVYFFATDLGVMSATATMLEDLTHIELSFRPHNSKVSKYMGAFLYKERLNEKDQLDEEKRIKDYILDSICQYQRKEEYSEDWFKHLQEKMIAELHEMNKIYN